MQAVQVTDLHALVDSRLPAAGRARVMRDLQEDEEARARADAWFADLESLRQLFDPVAAEPLPLARALAAKPLARGVPAEGMTPVRQGPHRSIRRRRGGDPANVRPGSRKDRVFVAVSAFAVGAAAALAGAAAFSALGGGAGSWLGAFWSLPVPWVF
jgi:anti-sigma factor RsiW